VSRDIDVSIILGIYNAEPYVRRCMESLVNQTLSDIEIIAVDDGSQDGSMDIVRDFASRDPRIRILTHDSNRGQSAAHNTGMAVAEGTCVRFVDNDDFMPPEATELLFDVHRKLKSQIVRGRMDSVVDGKVVALRWQHEIREAFNVGFADDVQLWRSLGGTFVYLFDRRFVQANQFTWPEDIVIGKDAIWNARCMTTADTISVIGDCVYYRVERSGSLMRPVHRDPGQYLAEAVAQVRVSYILRDSLPLAFLFNCHDELRYRRRRMTEAARSFSKNDALRIVAEYAKIFDMVSAETLFRFVKARRPWQKPVDDALTEFVELLDAGDVEAAHARLLAH
jgi:glycosyltransferase involved in cell wall biosynthesis